MTTTIENHTIGQGLDFFLTILNIKLKSLTTVSSFFAGLLTLVMNRPEYLKDDHVIFLDELMASGQMTSFKVSQILMHRFPFLSYEEVNNILTYWIYSYNDRHVVEG